MKNGAVTGSISQIETLLRLSPAVDSSQPTWINKFVKNIDYAKHKDIYNENRVISTPSDPKYKTYLPNLIRLRTLVKLVKITWY